MPLKSACKNRSMGSISMRFIIHGKEWTRLFATELLKNKLSRSASKGSRFLLISNCFELRNMEQSKDVS